MLLVLACGPARGAFPPARLGCSPGDTWLKPSAHYGDDFCQHRYVHIAHDAGETPGLALPGASGPFGTDAQLRAALKEDLVAR